MSNFLSGLAIFLISSGNVTYYNSSSWHNGTFLNYTDLYNVTGDPEYAGELETSYMISPTDLRDDFYLLFATTMKSC